MKFSQLIYATPALALLSAASVPFVAEAQQVRQQIPLGTSGHKVPFLDGANSWSAVNGFQAITGTTLALGGATIGSNALAVTGAARFSYDANNHLSITVNGAGTTSLSSTGSIGGISQSQTFFNSGFSTTGPIANGNGNLVVAGGEAASSTNQAQIGGANVRYRVFAQGRTSTTISANQSMANVFIATPSATTNSTGTHPVITQVGIKPLNITADASIVTDATTLYVEGPPTGLTPTNPATALWVASGAARFDGSIRVASHTPTSASDTCTAGRIAWDTDYMYVCTSTNSWKRTALSTW